MKRVLTWLLLIAVALAAAYVAVMFIPMGKGPM